MEIVSRKEALERGLKRYFTGKPCKNGHIAERFVSNGRCVECAHECGRDWRAANPERVREYWREYRAANADSLREYMREYRAANADSLREYEREQNRKWKAANPEKCAAHGAARRARRLKPTPAWADLSEIEKFYNLARRLMETTGEEHHVDHIIPLQGRRVCGLHVETNLQVLTAADNLAKGNRFEVG